MQPLSIDDPLQVNIQISSYSNGISISGINDQSLPAKIFIYNIIGEKILEQKIEQKRDIHFTIPLSQGVYIAKVLNKNGVSKTIKFISK